MAVSPQCAVFWVCHSHPAGSSAVIWAAELTWVCRFIMSASISELDSFSSLISLLSCLMSSSLSRTEWEHQHTAEEYQDNHQPYLLWLSKFPYNHHFYLWAWICAVASAYQTVDIITSGLLCLSLCMFSAECWCPWQTCFFFYISMCLCLSISSYSRSRGTCTWESTASYHRWLWTLQWYTRLQETWISSYLLMLWDNLTDWEGRLIRIKSSWRIKSITFHNTVYELIHLFTVYTVIENSGPSGEEG